jgi:hypothetical protein
VIIKTQKISKACLAYLQPPRPSKRVRLVNVITQLLLSDTGWAEIRIDKDIIRKIELVSSSLVK